MDELDEKSSCSWCSSDRMFFKVLDIQSAWVRERGANVCSAIQLPIGRRLSPLPRSPCCGPAEGTYQSVHRTVPWLPPNIRGGRSDSAGWQLTDEPQFPTIVRSAHNKCCWDPRHNAMISPVNRDMSGRRKWLCSQYVKLNKTWGGFPIHRESASVDSAAG